MVADQNALTVELIAVKVSGVAVGAAHQGLVFPSSIGGQLMDIRTSTASLAIMNARPWRRQQE